MKQINITYRKGSQFTWPRQVSEIFSMTFCPNKAFSVAWLYGTSVALEAIFLIVLDHPVNQAQVYKLINPKNFFGGLITMFHFIIDATFVDNWNIIKAAIKLRNLKIYRWVRFFNSREIFGIWRFSLVFVLPNWLVPWERKCSPPNISYIFKIYFVKWENSPLMWYKEQQRHLNKTHLNVVRVLRGFYKMCQQGEVAWGVV